MSCLRGKSVDRNKETTSRILLSIFNVIVWVTLCSSLKPCNRKLGSGNDILRERARKVVRYLSWAHY